MAARSRSRDFLTVRLIKLAAGIDKKCDGRHIADR
jgi:hypothetical protein